MFLARSPKRATQKRGAGLFPKLHTIRPQFIRGGPDRPLGAGGWRIYLWYLMGAVPRLSDAQRIVFRLSIGVANRR
jgi:hypothetical protein